MKSPSQRESKASFRDTMSSDFRESKVGAAKWRDGRASIEQHLELYIEDLSSPVQEEAGLGVMETLKGVNYLFTTLILGKFENLSIDVCKRLLSVLLSHAGTARSEFWTTSPEATGEARLALRVITEFLKHIHEFRDAVELLSITELRNSLKIHRHLRGADEEHKHVIAVFLQFLSIHIMKFSEWKDLVSENAHDAVEELLAKEEKLEQSIFRPKNMLPPKGSYYDFASERVVKLFNTDVENGLSADEVEDRESIFGLNELPVPNQKSVWVIFFNQFKDFILMILLFASIASIFVGDLKAAIVLLIVIGISVVTGLVQELKAEKALQALSSLNVPLATVMREGKQVEIPAKDLVPGDIVVLEEGAAAPADLRLVKCSQLRMMESLLTGESEPVKKDTAAIRVRKSPPLGDRLNMAFMSTTVASGRGIGVVVNTAGTTEVGRISSALASAEVVATPLQVKLGKLGKSLVFVSMIACGLFVVVGILQGLGWDVVEAGISLAVSVIPEGLATVVTMTLALGMQRMARRNAIIRRMPAVETLGAVTTICSDKTGTLTEGKMKMEILWMCKKPQVDFIGSGLIPTEGEARRGDEKIILEDNDKKQIESNVDVERIAFAVCDLCNNASVNESEEEKGQWNMVGDSTEVALKVACRKAQISTNYWSNFIDSKANRVLEFAFNSDRKRMSVLYKLPKNVIDSKEFMGIPLPANASYVLLAKGSPERILELCSKALLPSKTENIPEEEEKKQEESGDYKMSEIELSKGMVEEIDTNGTKYAEKSMRLLALAYRFVSSDEFDKWSKGEDSLEYSKDAEKDLIFTGLVGIVDPPREEVFTAVARCLTAGIRVCMITGDHHRTAISVARAIGIYKPEHDKAIKGKNLTTISAAQLASYSPFPTVFSRVDPSDKFKIVKSLQLRGEIVAMTGDGVNDAAAIKQADVGIAMGKSGTELTRRVADVILVDDNFSTIVSAVEEGRRIFDNIVKFLVYLLSCNSAEVFFMLIAVTIDYPVPFVSVMILWANIFADVPPSLSLGLEPPEQGVMLRQPRDPAKDVFTRKTVFIVMSYGMLMALITLGVFYYFLDIKNESLEDARSVTFISLAMLQLVHSFLCRSIKETAFTRTIFNNHWMVAAFLLSFLLCVAGDYLPGLNDILELEPLNSTHWVAVLISVVVHILCVELLKFIIRRFENRPLPHAYKSSEDIELHVEKVQNVKDVF